MSARRRRSPSAAYLIAAVFVAACTGTDTRSTAGTPANVSEFITTFGRLFCEKVRACDTSLAVYSQAECEALVSADLNSGSLERALASGAIAFDANAATACLALLAASPECAAEGWSNDYCLEETVFVGTLPAGSACDSNNTGLCRPGTVCSVDPFSDACGICNAVTLADIGQPCQVNADCSQTAQRLAYCDFDPIDGRDECIAWANPTVVAAGQPCDTGDVVCAVGAECAWNTDGLCHPQIPLDAECDPIGDVGCIGSAPCVDDATSSLGGRCRALVLARTVGAACDLVGNTFVECDRSADLDCDRSTHTCFTVVPSGVGDACSDAPCAVGTFCDGYAAVPVCAALRANGSACHGGWECDSGLCAGIGAARVCATPSGTAAACGP